jgi:hypothetical protein
MSRPFGSDTSTPDALLQGHLMQRSMSITAGAPYNLQENREINAHRSVARASLAMDVLRSSVLAFTEREVRGVLAVLLPFSEPPGVDSEVAVPFALRVPFAAFSARRFCLDAEGGMVSMSC